MVLQNTDPNDAGAIERRASKVLLDADVDLATREPGDEVSGLLERARGAGYP